MPGCIAGFYGYQRSGKTMLAYLLSDFMNKKYNIPIYSNIHVKNWNPISSLKDVPLNYEPKVLLLDEVYYFMDSRTWQQNTSASIFFNTIGKQNILLIITAIDPSEVEIRLRRQHNFMVMCKGDRDNIYYRILDVQRNLKKDFSIQKTPDLFKSLKYDTLQVPDFVDCNIKDFVKYNQNKRSVTNKWI